MTHDPMRPPTTRAIAAHVERATQARTEQPAEETAAGKSTAQVYADRVLPGYAADEELRERVRKQGMVARGVLTAEVQPVEDDDEVDAEPEVIEPEEEKPLRTADLYARRTLAAHSAEAASARVAQRNVALHQPIDPWSAA